MHKELIRQLLLHLSLLNADFTIQGLLFSDFQIKVFKEKYLITNRVKNEDCKIQLRKLRKFQVAIMSLTIQLVQDRPRFFDQVGHQTTNAFIGNKYFFT